MDYRYLKVFIDAAESLNFAKTAKALRIAPSAVTRQIQLFEESIGEALFIRSNQRVILTQRGQEILELVRPVEEWTTKQKRRTIRVAGLSGVLDTYFWPKILKSELLEVANIEVQEAVSRDAIRMLEAGEVDVALVNRKEDSSLVSYFSMGTESFALISKQKISLDEVGKQTWIYGESGEMLKQISGHKAERPYIKIGSIQHVYNLVEAGAGVAVVPDSAALEKRKFHRRKLDVRSKAIYLAVLNYGRLPSHLGLALKLLT